MVMNVAKIFFEERMRSFEELNSTDRKYAILGYIVAFSVFYLFYKSIVISLLGGFSFLLFKGSYENHKKLKKNKALKLQFKDFLYSISSSFSIGRQMPEAIREAVPLLENLHGEDSLLSSELKKSLALIDDMRVNEEKVLREFSEEMQIDEIIQFFELYFTCRKTGADIRHVIEKSANVLLDKMSIKKEIETLTAQKRFEGRLIAIMPIGLLFILNISSNSYLDPLYTTLQGRLLMSTALVIIYLAYKRIERLTDIDV